MTPQRFLITCTVNPDHSWLAHKPGPARCPICKAETMGENKMPTEIINWGITTEDNALLIKVAERAMRELTDYPDDKHTLVMDLNACHSNGCLLDFEGLLNAPLMDFSHDIYGIRKAINRDTGKLTEDRFTPRYAFANRVPELRAKLAELESANKKLQEEKEVLVESWPEEPLHLPGGITIYGATEREREILRKRGEFSARYCEAKGWPTDGAKLTIEQIMEIREQEGWKKPQ